MILDFLISLLSYDYIIKSEKKSEKYLHNHQRISLKDTVSSDGKHMINVIQVKIYWTVASQLKHFKL